MNKLNAIHDYTNSPNLFSDLDITKSANEPVLSQDVPILLTRALPEKSKWFGDSRLFGIAVLGLLCVAAALVLVYGPAQ